VTLTLTSDDLESHIVVNVSSTLTNSTIWFVAALCLIVDVRTDVHRPTYVRTYGRTDIFTGFIRSSRRRWPNQTNTENTHHSVIYLHFKIRVSCCLAW